MISLETKLWSLANDDSHFIFNDKNGLLNKVHKIVIALYLITNHLKDIDNIKINIRSVGDSLIKDITEIPSEELDKGLSGITLKGDVKDKIEDINNNLKKVLINLELAEISGSIKESNLAIVRVEVKRRLKDLALISLSQFDNQFNLKQDDFEVHEQELLNKNKVARSKSIKSKRQIKTEDVLGKKDSNVLSLKSNINKQTQAPNFFFKGHKRQLDAVLYGGQDNNVKDIKKIDSKIPSRTLNQVVEIKDRRERIINIVKQKGEVGIKDISEIIKDCSEKTIQRDLLEMVSDNVLNKVGDRRWSRYSLV